MTDHRTSHSAPMTATNAGLAARAEVFLGPAIFSAVLAYLILAMPALEHLLVNKDHGYQLALARQILHGKALYVDFFTHYGPGIAYSSAAAMSLAPGSPLPEMILCAIGYASAITLAMLIVRRHSPGKAGLFIAFAVVLLLLLSLAKFYKWYYWLFPMLTLFIGLVPRAGGLAKRRCVTLGAVAGLAWLFRPDIGLASTATALAAICGAACIDPELGAVRRVQSSVSGIFPAAIAWGGVVGSWSVFLLVTAGWEPVVDQYVFYFDAAQDLVHRMAISPFPFDMTQPLSPKNRTAWAQVVVLVTALVGFAVGVSGFWEKEVRERVQRFTIGIVACSAAATLPQAFHRADAAHLAQVIPVLVVLVALLSRPAVMHAGGLRWLAMCGRVLAIGWAIGLPFVPFPVETNAPTYRPFARLASLARPDLSSVEKHSAIASMFHYVNQHAEPNATVLILPRESLVYEAQSYYWIDRTAAGILQAYYMELYATSPWPARNAKEIRANPPMYIVTERRALQPDYKNETLERFHPDLWNYFRQQPTEAWYQNDTWLVLRVVQ